MQNTAPRTRSVDLAADLSVTLTEAGEGRPVLILHGGAGPFSVASIAQHVAKTAHAITPTHPGWNGTPRPAWLSGVDDVALAYLQYLADAGLRDVLVIGSSVGGWIGAEMAVRDRAGMISGLVLINATGVQIDGESILDLSKLDPRGIAEAAYHDADRFYVDPSTLPAEQVARQRANQVTLRSISGPDMHDPKLRRRLASVRIPTLVLWGVSDRVTKPSYGQQYANAFGNARFEPIEQAGHLPQLEQPAATFARLDAFVAESSKAA
jgi:pimeloyl-ACP methyl ester carboxylesterase